MAPPTAAVAVGDQLPPSVTLYENNPGIHKGADRHTRTKIQEGACCSLEDGSS